MYCATGRREGATHPFAMLLVFVFVFASVCVGGWRLGEGTRAVGDSGPFGVGRFGRFDLSGAVAVRSLESR
jgi:hypothetical protein